MKKYINSENKNSSMKQNIILVLLSIIFFGSILSVNSISLSDLKAYYKFDNSSLNDSISGVTATTGGAVYVAGGIIGGAYEFDGVNDLVNLTTRADLNLFQNISYGAWVRPDQTTGFFPIISKSSSAANYDQYIVYHMNGAYTCRVRNTLNAVFDATSLTSVAKNMTWQFVMCTVSDTNLSLYVNGVYQSSVAITGTRGTVSHTVLIGNQITSQFFDGLIDEPQIWNRSLTTSEILELYNSGLGIQFPFRQITYNSILVNNISLTNNLILNNSYLYFNLNINNQTTNSQINTTMRYYYYWNSTLINTLQQNNTVLPNFSIPYLANGVYLFQFNSSNNETSSQVYNYTIVVNVPVSSSSTAYAQEDLIQQTTPYNNQIIGLSENINYYLSHPADCIISLNSNIIYQVINSNTYQANTSFNLGSNTLQFYCYYDYNSTIRYYDFEIVNFEVRNFTGSTTINLLLDSSEIDLETESLYLVTPCLQTKIKGVDGQYGSIFNPDGVRITKIDEQGYAQLVLPEGNYELCIFNGILNAPTTNLTTQYTVTEAYGQKPIGTLSVTNSTTQNYVIKDLKKSEIYDKYNILNPRLDIAWGTTWTTLITGFLLFIIGIISIGIGTRIPDGSKVVIIGIVCIILSLGFSLGGFIFLIF